MQILKHIRLVVSARHCSEIYTLSKRGYIVGYLVILLVLASEISLVNLILEVVLNIKQHGVHFIGLLSHPIFLGSCDFSIRDTRFHTIWLMRMTVLESSPPNELLTIFSCVFHDLISHPMQFHDLLLHKNIGIIWVCHHILYTITFTVITIWILFCLLLIPMVIFLLLQLSLAPLSERMPTIPPLFRLFHSTTFLLYRKWAGRAHGSVFYGRAIVVYLEGGVWDVWLFFGLRYVGVLTWVFESSLFFGCHLLQQILIKIIGQLLLQRQPIFFLLLFYQIYGILNDQLILVLFSILFFTI